MFVDISERIGLVKKKFEHKRISNGVRPKSVRTFLVTKNQPPISFILHLVGQTQTSFKGASIFEIF